MTEDFEVSVTEHYDIDTMKTDWLVIEKTPGQQKIMASCPYPKFAERVAEGLRVLGPETD